MEEFLPEIDIFELMAANVKEIVRSSYYAYEKYSRLVLKQIVEVKVSLHSQDAEFDEEDDEFEDEKDALVRTE